jgi:hypothetical protein
MLDNNKIDLEKLDADVLFDVPDDALERAAAGGAGQAVTFGVCANWYYCGWPL